MPSNSFGFPKTQSVVFVGRKSAADFRCIEARCVVARFYVLEDKKRFYRYLLLMTSVHVCANKHEMACSLQA